MMMMMMELGGRVEIAILARLGSVNGLLAVKDPAIEALVRLLERLLRTLCGLVHEEGEALGLPGRLVQAQGTLLDLAVFGEEMQQAMWVDVGGDVADVDLALGVLRDGRGRCGDGAGGGKLASGHAVADALLGLPEGAASGGAVLEEDKTVAFRLSGELVGDGVAVLDVAVGLEGVEKGIGGGVPS